MADASNITKICTACSAEKPLSAFSPSKLGKHGRRSRCKPCETAQSKARALEKQVLVDRKTCSNCGATKSAGEFYPMKYSLDGLTALCRECNASYRRTLPSRGRAARRKDAIRRAEREGRQYPRPRVATRYQREQHASRCWRAWLYELAPDGWVGEYYAALGKPWLNHRLPRSEREVLRAINDRIRWREKKLRRQGRLQWCIIRALKDGGTSPTVEAELGYTISALRNHLERQFKRGMTWDKFLGGEIHIDHIVPTIAFDLSKREEIVACFAMTNLQPMWALKNMQKGGKRLTLL